MRSNLMKDLRIKPIIGYTVLDRRHFINRLTIFRLQLKIQQGKEIKRDQFLIFNLFEFPKMIVQVDTMLSFIYAI